MSEHSDNYATYNLSFHDSDYRDYKHTKNLIDVVKTLSSYTNSCAFYETEVKVNTNIDKFEIIAKHKLKNNGYLTTVDGDHSMVHAQIYTNLPVEYMHGILTGKYCSHLNLKKIDNVSVYLDQEDESDEHYKLVDEIEEEYNKEE